MVFLVIPAFNANGQHWAFNDWYKTPKVDIDQHNYFNLAKTLATNLVTPSALTYYKELLKPLGYLPIIGLPWLVLAFPDLLINVSSSYPGMETITLHYNSGIIPALIVSLIAAVYYLKLFFDKLAPSKWKKYAPGMITVVTMGILILAAQANYEEGPLPFSKANTSYLYQIDANEQAFEQVLQTLPPDAIIAASYTVRPHLTHRETVTNLPEIPANTDYIAVKKGDSTMEASSPIISTFSLTPSINTPVGEFDLQTHLGDFYLYHRS
jgi:uncharacterized membrane protein